MFIAVFGLYSRDRLTLLGLEGLLGDCSLPSAVSESRFGMGNVALGPFRFSFTVQEYLKSQADVVLRIIATLSRHHYYASRHAVSGSRKCPTSPLAQ